MGRPDIYPDVLSAAWPALEVAGIPRGEYVDAVLATDFLCRAVVGLRPSRITARWSASYAPQGYVVYSAHTGASSWGGLTYLAAALAMAAERAERGLWELRDGIEVPLAAAASVVTANDWAQPLHLHYHKDVEDQLGRNWGARSR